MREKIILIVFNNVNIIKYCKKLSIDYNELRSQLILELYNMKLSKLINSYDKGYLEYTCFKIISNIKKGTVKNTYNYNMNKKCELQDIIEEIPILDESKDTLDAITVNLNDIHIYDRQLFKYYYYDDMNLREISLLTGINFRSVHYSIDKTRKEIKKRLDI